MKNEQGKRVRFLAGVGSGVALAAILVRGGQALLLAGVGSGVALAAICPPAAVAVGLLGFLRSARKVAQNPDDPYAVADLVTGYGGLVGNGSSDTGRK